MVAETRCHHLTFVLKEGVCTCQSCGHSWTGTKVWTRQPKEPCERCPKCREVTESAPGVCGHCGANLWTADGSWPNEQDDVSGADPVEVQSSDPLAGSQAALNGPSGSPNSAPDRDHQIRQLRGALRDAIAFIDPDSAGDYELWKGLVDG